MEALRVQRTGHGGSAGLISRAGAPVGGASSSRAYGAGARPDRADRVGVRCAPFTQAAGLVEPGEAPASAGGFGAGAAELLEAIAAVNAAAVAAPGALALADYTEAAQYAGMAEELSRTVEYLQILSAGAVDRTRTRAITEAATRAARSSRNGRSWVTGWDNGTETLNETDTSWPAATEIPARHVPASPADDSCKNTAEFLRLSLRIGISEARRRLHLAHDTLPATTLTGDTTPPPREHLAAGLAPTTPDTATDADTDTTDPGNTAPGQETPGLRSGGSAVSSRAGTIISLTLDRLQHQTTPETLARIEHDLTRTAATADPDFLARVARRWAETLDADGTEPTEEALRHTQGAFIRKPRHGLHHLEIFATTDQYEHLLTVMNTATNPRTTSPDTSGADTGTGTGTGEDVWLNTDPDLDRRTRPQKQLDGIIGAVKAALTTNTLPTTGGNRPQIIATINYQDLLPHTRTTAPGTDGGDGAAGPARGRGAGAVWAGAGGAHAVWAGSGARAGSGLPGGTGTGNFVFAGPVAAATLRKIACDADIIPALLGTHSEILDLGRKSRLFTPAQRLALTARDQGCTFPNCAIPAPWCEAHHITYWSQNGPTNLDNGALLCTHHHHLIHKEQWTITTQNGVPWYTPPRHIDPTQKPQQNHYFKPPPLPRE